MKSAGKNHPREKIFIRRDEISIAEGQVSSELPSDEIVNPTTFRIDRKCLPEGKFLRNYYLLLTKLRIFFLHYTFRINSGNTGSELKTDR